MINMEPQFVSSSDFLNYWGVNLNKELKGDSNQSNKADLFLRRIEDRLMVWVDANTFRNVGWDELKENYKFRTEKEKECAQIRREAWQKAILTQAMYVFRNSDISLDSGYDPEKGVIAQKNDLASIEICQAAIDFIKRAGLYNHVVSNRNRYLFF